MSPHRPSHRLGRRAVVLAGVASAAAAAHTPAWALGVRPDRPRRLTVAVYPLVDEIVRQAIPFWQRQHPDVGIQVVSRQYADHHTAMTTALSTSVGLPDVMALEQSYVGRFSHGLGLEDLAKPPFEAGRHRDRFVPYAFAQTVNRRGEIIAVPTDIGPGTLLYRNDLLARAGVSEVELTRSWESYVDAGLRIKAATGAYLIANAQALKDIVIRSGLRVGEGLYFDRDSRVLVRSPRFERAFALAQRVRQGKLDARVNAWSNEWAEGFRRGTLATELSGAWMVGQMANWVAPTTRGLWRAAPLPEGTFVSYGGTFYAIPRRADPTRKALGWALIQLLTMDRERQFAAFQSQDAFPALLETHEDAFFEAPLPFLGGQAARGLWRDSARRIQATEVHKQNNFADEVVATELDNVLERGKPVAVALADAERLLQRRALR